MGKHGVRPDPERIKAITDWTVPVDVKGIKKIFGLVAYLHKHLRSYAEMTVRLSVRLKRTRNGHGTLIVSVPVKVSSRA